MILDKIARIRPATPEDVGQIEKAAKEDGCGLLYPTHVVQKNKKVAGFISLGVVPMVGLWLDSKEIKARDTVNVCSFIDDAMAHRNVLTYAIPLHYGSKFTQHLSELGCIPVGQHSLFFKTSTI